MQSVGGKSTALQQSGTYGSKTIRMSRELPFNDLSCGYIRIITFILCLSFENGMESLGYCTFTVCIATVNLLF